MENKKSIKPSQQDEDGPNKKLRTAGKSNNNIEPETKTETCCSCSLLPFDIVADILSRLPANSVAKFRCVCKQWLSLTYDPCFLKSQHERSSSYMIIDKQVISGNIRLYDFRNGDGRNPARSLYTLNLGKRIWRFYKLSNFVDGLTCVYGRPDFSDVHLLNPTTRELHKLPENKVRSRLQCFEYETFGLGVDLTMRQYKVVRLFSGYGCRYSYCQIHTVGTAQWRCLGEAPFRFLHNSSPVLLHGALHWIGYVLRVDHQETKRCLFEFNIKDEEFGSAMCIPYPSLFHEHSVCLKEFGGKLWLTFWNMSEMSFEIWILKDYLNNTWVKEYKFHSSSLSSLQEDFHDAEILIKFYENAGWYAGWYVLRYNPRTGAFCKLLQGGRHYIHAEGQDLAIYRESLISPKKLLKASQR